jgi:hypothetical protein
MKIAIELTRFCCNITQSFDMAGYSCYEHNQHDGVFLLHWAIAGIHRTSSFRRCILLNSTETYSMNASNAGSSMDLSSISLCMFAQWFRTLCLAVTDCSSSWLALQVSRLGTKALAISIPFSVIIGLLASVTTIALGEASFLHSMISLNPQCLCSLLTLDANKVVYILGWLPDFVVTCA